MSLLPLNVLRYLLVYRVNAPMVWLSPFPSLEFSLVLGTLIAESLPTVQARPWRKALLPWEEAGGASFIKNKDLDRVPEAAWPVDAVIFYYPGKRAYGMGEPILVELKLMGRGADHDFFLEIILPALEAASKTMDPALQSGNSLWGRFDIQSVYVAHGPSWAPLVQDGRLDLRYKPSPLQWYDGLDFQSDSHRRFRDLIWVTPFEFLKEKDDPGQGKRSSRTRHQNAPSLHDILSLLLLRMNGISTGKRGRFNKFWHLLDPEARTSFEEILEFSSKVSVTQEFLQPVAKASPGRFIGRQRFGNIPSSAFPYLGLASIFHVGEHTHFGCGTFILR